MGICPPSLAAEGGPVFVEYLNIIQATIPLGLTTIATIQTGTAGLQLTIVACGFTALSVGYTLKVRPGGADIDNSQFFREKGNVFFGRPLFGGNSEFWGFALKPREEYVIEAEATTADVIALTISTSQLFNSGAPEVCPPPTTAGPGSGYSSGFSGGF